MRIQHLVRLLLFLHGRGSRTRTGKCLTFGRRGFRGGGSIRMNAENLIETETGQEFAADPRILEALIDFLSEGLAEGTPGTFGPVVQIEDEPTLLEQALGLAGRDPSWRLRGRRRRKGFTAPSTAAVE